MAVEDPLRGSWEPPADSPRALPGAMVNRPLRGHWGQPSGYGVFLEGVRPSGDRECQVRGRVVPAESSTFPLSVRHYVPGRRTGRTTRAGLLDKPLCPCSPGSRCSLRTTGPTNSLAPPAIWSPPRAGPACRSPEAELAGRRSRCMVWACAGVIFSGAPRAKSARRCMVWQLGARFVPMARRFLSSVRPAAEGSAGQRSRSSRQVAEQ